jgi:hypothetical protein
MRQRISSKPSRPRSKSISTTSEGSSLDALVAILFLLLGGLYGMVAR